MPDEKDRKLRPVEDTRYTARIRREGGPERMTMLGGGLGRPGERRQRVQRMTGPSTVTVRQTNPEAMDDPIELAILQHKIRGQLMELQSGNMHPMKRVQMQDKQLTGHIELVTQREMRKTQIQQGHTAFLDKFHTLIGKLMGQKDKDGNPLYDGDQAAKMAWSWLGPMAPEGLEGRMPEGFVKATGAAALAPGLTAEQSMAQQKFAEQKHQFDRSQQAIQGRFETEQDRFRAGTEAQERIRVQAKAEAREMQRADMMTNLRERTAQIVSERSTDKGGYNPVFAWRSAVDEVAEELKRLGFDPKEMKRPGQDWVNKQPWNPPEENRLKKKILKRQAEPREDRGGIQRIIKGYDESYSKILETIEKMFTATPTDARLYDHQIRMLLDRVARDISPEAAAELEERISPLIPGQTPQPQ